MKILHKKQKSCRRICGEASFCAFEIYPNWPGPIWQICKDPTGISALTEQDTTEGRDRVVPPNVSIGPEAHVHVVPLLQLQKHPVASIVGSVVRIFVVVGHHNELVVLHHGQTHHVRSSGVIKEGEVVNACNGRSEDAWEKIAESNGRSSCGKCCLLQHSGAAEEQRPL